MSNDTKTLTVTIDKAAKILGIGRSLAYSAAKSGDIPTIRIGGRILVPMAALEEKLRLAGNAAA